MAGLVCIPRCDVRSRLTDAQRTVFTECTQRQNPPSRPVREGWIIVGRRGGKSFVLALCAVYIAAFRTYRQYLVPGERGTIMIIATDRRQARIIHRYVGALLSVPALRQLLERETATGFDLNNQVTIEIHTASFRSTRGYAIIAACLDELAFWPTEADNAEPDYEVINTASRYGAIPDLCPVVCELALFQERCVVGGLPPTLRSRRR